MPDTALGIILENKCAGSILITGASGFLGGFLLEELVALKGNNVKIVALHCRDLDLLTQAKFGDCVEWRKVDIVVDDLSEVVAGVDTVFHLAAFSTTSELNADRIKMKSINVMGTDRLGRACKASGVRHFIFVSSIAACEFSSSKQIDEVVGFPSSTYGVTKKLAEDALLRLCGDGFEVTIFRPTALFGETHLGSVYDLVTAVKRGYCFVFGRGDNCANFYYIRDFVDVLIEADSNPRVYSQVFIAADSSCSVRDFVSYISVELDLEREVRSVPMMIGLIAGVICDFVAKLTGKSLPFSRRRFRAMIRDCEYSNKKLITVLGIHPRYGLRAGVNRTIRWYRETNII